MHPQNLQQLATELQGELVNSPLTPITCSTVTAATSEVVAGALFVAIRGFKVDGHSLVDDAFKRGAVACVVEDPAALRGRPGITVGNTRLALSRLASLFNGEPSRKLSVVGVTGTNGKTTTNWIIYSVMNRIGGGALRVGTLGSELLGTERFEGSLTSPDALTINALLARAVEAGAKAAVMETSSHALDQGRVEDVAFDVGVFTNLTRDHLDYHKTFEAYYLAKSHLFDLVKQSTKDPRAAVINADCEYGVRLIRYCEELGLKVFSFGASSSAEIRIESISETPSAMQIAVVVRSAGRKFLIEAPFIGKHNAENLVAAFGACVALGYDPERVVECLKDIPQVPGRLERVGQGSRRVFVDYAHTPDALERALAALRVSSRGKLWALFGCGGDRDRGKRPEMARVAAAQADYVVVTSDNPRTEEPLSIIDDILGSGICPAMVEVDRAKAIEAAIRASGEDDTILIAGKGHEDYQIIGTEKIHFSDQEVALAVLNRL